MVDLGQADIAFDVDRVYRVASLVYGRLDRDRARFETLLNDSAWRDDLRHAREVFGDATVKTLTLVRAFEGERRQEAEAVIELGSKLTERVSQTLVGLVLATGGSRLKRTADWQAVHQAARQAGLGDVLLGFDDRVRNADAHVDFDVSATEIKLGRNRAKPKRLSDDELVDLVLAAVESTASIFAAIDCVIAELGHPAAGDMQADIEPEEVVRILAAIAGLEAARVELKNGVVELAGVPVGSARVRPMSVAAMLGPSLPDDTRLVRVSVKGSGSAVRGETRYAALRRFQKAPPGTKEIVFLEYGSQATLNGRPLLSRNHVRKAAAVYLGRTMETGYTANAEVLDALIDVAQRVGDPQLLESAKSFVEGLRSREGLEPRSRPSRPAIDRLAAWLELDPGPIRDGSEPHL